MTEMNMNEDHLEDDDTCPKGVEEEWVFVRTYCDIQFFPKEAHGEVETGIKTAIFSVTARSWTEAVEKGAALLDGRDAKKGHSEGKFRGIGWSDSARPVAGLREAAQGTARLTGRANPMFQPALDGLTVNPLAEAFTCAGCDEFCSATLDEGGIWRNQDEANAVIFTTVPGRDAITRTDFCCAECLQLSYASQQNPS